MPTPRLATLLVLLAASPAPAQTTPPPETAAGPAAASACTATLSGAVTARFECQMDASWDASRVVLVVAADGPVAGVRAIVPARLELPYPLEGKTYGLAAMVAGESRVRLANGDEYLASGARGEIALEVNGLERYATPRKRYRVAGTLRARLVPVAPGGAGEVHLELRF